MNPFRILGHLLLWSGFLGGAYLAVCNAEVANDKWSTINWPLYITALALGTAGVVLLRLTQKQAATHAHKLDADIKVLEVSTKELLSKLGDLIKGLDRIDVDTVHKLIDSQLAEDVANFVEARESLIHTYGLRQYAELMTDFSIAERNINRAWSASADGYIDEVRLSLDRADDRLQRVARNLVEYKKAVVT